jgi:hypothetical protein
MEIVAPGRHFVGEGRDAVDDGHSKVQLKGSSVSTSTIRRTTVRSGL